MPLPATYDLAYTRGDTVALPPMGLRAGGTDADLGGYTLRVQFRLALPGGTFSAPAPAAGDLIHPSAAFSAGPAAAGATRLACPACPAASSGLWPPGVHLWDAEFASPAGVVTTFVGGSVTVAGDTTR